MPRPVLTRKDIARRTGLSTDTVRRNEARLGLDRARISVNKRVIVYAHRRAVKALRSRGFEV